MKILNKLKISIFTVIILVSCIVSIYQVNATSEKRINVITQSNENYYIENNDIIIEYSDGSYVIINNNNTYSYFVLDLGDWNYTCNSVQELNNLIASYNSCKSEYNNYDSIYVINSYIKNDSSLITEYNDKSWSIQNDELNYYEFYPALTEDYSIVFNNIIDMNKCIDTYTSIKETGMY